MAPNDSGSSITARCILPLDTYGRTMGFIPFASDPRPGRQDTLDVSSASATSLLKSRAQQTSVDGCAAMPRMAIVRNFMLANALLIA